MISYKIFHQNVQKLLWHQKALEKIRWNQLDTFKIYKKTKMFINNINFSQDQNIDNKYWTDTTMPEAMAKRVWERREKDVYLYINFLEIRASSSLGHITPTEVALTHKYLIISKYFPIFDHLTNTFAPTYQYLSN